jgi:hypothetical protein
MTEEQKFYTEIGRKIIDAQESQMFGKPCFKINGKAFVSFFNNEMIFKLTGEAHSEALSLDGSQLFDPSGKRPMKEWIQIPYDYKKLWAKFAKEAAKYVKEKTTK